MVLLGNKSTNLVMMGFIQYDIKLWVVTNVFTSYWLGYIHCINPWDIGVLIFRKPCIFGTPHTFGKFNFSIQISIY